MNASTFLASQFEFKAWANEELVSALRHLDGEKHGAERHTSIRLLNHIYVVDRIFAGHLTGTAHGFTATNTAETPTLDGLAVSLAESDAWYVNHVPTLSPAMLDAGLDFTFTDGQHGRMTRGEMLSHVLAHGGYHRGAIGRILAQTGMAPPREIYTRFLHEREPVRRLTTRAAAGG